MIKKHYGFTVDSEKPTTGVFNTHGIEFINEAADEGIDLSWEQAMEEHEKECKSAEHDNCYDMMDVESTDFLVGMQKVGDKYEIDPTADWSGIIDFDRGVVQVLNSKWAVRCNLCSPCYPGQGEGDTPGEFLAFAPSPEDIGEARDLQRRLINLETGELVYRENMSKEELVKDLGITDAFDWAIPHDWVGAVVLYFKARKDMYAADGSPILPDNLQDIHVPAHFIWLYDGKAKIFGRPFPLTETGKKILNFANIEY